jgi:predicted transcriptional regulator
MTTTGRPRTGQRTKNLNISLNPALISRIEGLATKENRTKSNMAAVLIAEAIKGRERDEKCK